MPGAAVLRPGVPDDDNRDYLPESLKGSEIVVNENGNNSQPYPPLLREHQGVVADGITDVWYTYVPSSYDPAGPTPLVIALHGGLMTGWGQAVYTSWVNVADREGFIVLFPTASSRRLWTVELSAASLPAATTPNSNGLYLNQPAASADVNHDIRLVLGLIDRLATEYEIDRSRIFMQGMSLGDSMTAFFARNFGNLLAGAAGSGGSTDPALLFDEQGGVVNRGGPLAIWQSRLDLDIGPSLFSDDAAEVNRLNREYWLRVNGVTEPPAIAVRGVDSFAFYRGANADVVFRDVHGRDHGQTFDDAELVWDYLFSGVRRSADGSIERIGPALAPVGDSFAIAVTDDRKLAWVSGDRVAMPVAAFTWEAARYHGMGGEREVRGTYLFVPLSFLATVFRGDLQVGDHGASAVLTLPDGRTLQFARGVIGCVLDGRVTSMPAEAVVRERELCISLEWFALNVMSLWSSTRSGVTYVTDHYAELGGNMARLISDLLS